MPLPLPEIGLARRNNTLQSYNVKKKLKKSLTVERRKRLSVIPRLYKWNGKIFINAKKDDLLV
jgi:hypothetical protein